MFGMVTAMMGRQIVLAGVVLSVVGCGVSQVLAPSERAELERARQLWESTGVHSYVVEFKRECVCLRSGVWIQLTVVHDSVVEAVVMSTGERLATGPNEPWLRVDEFFERVERLAADPGGLLSIRVAFDSTLGYPTFVSMTAESVSDYARQDNFIYWLRNLTPSAE
jgi:hypothetical protein